MSTRSHSRGQRSANRFSLVAVWLLAACSGGTNTMDASGDAARDTSAGDTAMMSDVPTDSVAQDVGSQDVTAVDTPSPDVATNDAVSTDSNTMDTNTSDSSDVVRTDTPPADVARTDTPAVDVVRPDVTTPDASMCAAMNAMGVGACDRFLGYAWNGSACVGLSGCSCAGSDCSRLFTDMTTCQAAAARCDCRITSCPGSQTCEPCRGVGGLVYACLASGTAC